MEPKPRNLEDLFESSVKLEETHLEEGYRDGFYDGLVSGKEEGRQVGLKHGFQVGEELGFYRGCVDVWNSAIGIHPEAFSARVKKSINLMEELLEKYPVLEPENESLQEIMDALRLKFRVISASLGVRLEYEGYPKEEKGIEF